MINKFNQFIESKPIEKLREFYNSYYFIFIVSFLCIITNLFAIELFIAPIGIVLIGFSLIICEDTRALLLAILFVPSAESFKNGLSHRPLNTTSIYSSKPVIIYFSILLTILLLTLIFHIIYYKDYKKIINTKYPMLISIVILCFTYSLGGAFTKEYSINNFLFGFFTMLWISFIYIYFKATLFESKTKKDILKYCGFFALAFEMMMIVELVGIYIISSPIVDGTINKELIKTGWAESNYLGMYMLLLIPFIFYLATIEKHPSIYISIIALIDIATLFTEGRTAILFAAIFTIIGCATLLILKETKKKEILFTYLGIFLIAGIAYAIKFDYVNNLFLSMIKKGTNLSGRDEIYQIGIDAFKSNPFTGKGWYYLGKQDNQYIWHNGMISDYQFAPYWKYHNILIQFLAATGLVGLLGFIVHIYFVSKYSVKNYNKEQLFTILAICIIISTSIFDNPFFDYGFERFYTILLIIISLDKLKEKSNEEIIELKEEIKSQEA